MAQRRRNGGIGLVAPVSAALPSGDEVSVQSGDEVSGQAGDEVSVQSGDGDHRSGR